MLSLPPLSLYIHIPWCVQKCPYCDFNSHGLKEAIPEKQYVDALLTDLTIDKHLAQGRKLSSIFIGGGTPSLLSESAIERLLVGVEQLIPFSDNIEITLEANPGTVESDRFAGYRQAGVNRISIGIQSFNPEHLKVLGRIHNTEEAVNAARLAQSTGLNSFNLDLMHGLPDQTPEQALDDLKQAIALNPPHLSWYQLTIEPNTSFYSRPPTLPDDDTLWDIQEKGHAMLEQAGYTQYEVSAYAKAGYQCQHNLNYWRFGDYLGIGCGAHSKISLPLENQLLRQEKIKHPKGYLSADKQFVYKSWQVAKDEKAFEFFMNRLRLKEPCPKADFTVLTGIELSTIAPVIQEAIQDGLLLDDGKNWQVTEKGLFYLNELLDRFLEEAA